MSKQLSLTRSQLAEKILHLDGKPFSLDDYKHMRTIYDSSHDSIVLHTSRQISKSTTLANLMTLNSVAIPGFRSLYISPTVDQTKIFSNDRVATVIENSPFIKKYYLNSRLTQNVFTKQLANQSKMYLRYALLNADRIRGISADMNLFDECFAPNMEVLTKEGWADFEDLDLETELATSTEENKLEFQKPSRVFSKHFSGNLLEFNHQSFRLTVTPGHNIFASQELNTGYYRDPKRKGWFLDTAENMKNKNFKMTSVAEYKKSGDKTFIIPGGKTTKKPNGKPYQDGRTVIFPDKQVSTSTFMEFMGWFLSEGHVRKGTNTICITQNYDTEHYHAIEKCLQKLPFSYNVFISKQEDASAYFSISDRTLAEYLRPLGKSHDKYIPQELLEQTKYLEILLRSLYDGDAMRHQEDVSQWGELNTASKELANDVQRAWLYLGRKATIRQVTEKYNETIMYRVRPLQINYKVFWNAKDRVKEVPYEGLVYCATVPNGTLIVRDKKEKTCVISGNCQDLLRDIIPVVNQTMSRSMHKLNLFAGTPKTSTSTLGQLWKNSTKNEWMSKCGHCGRWNYLDDKNIGKHGPICRYCGKDLDTRQGTWVRTGEEDATHQGFRVNQLMFANAPWVNWNKDIITFRESNSEAVFFNEVLGLSYDAGEKPITEADIRACCDPSFEMNPNPSDIILSKPTYMGLDYGPVNSRTSNTVSVILQNEGDKLRVVFAKKYIGPKASYDYIHRDIPYMFQKWGVILVGSDYGMGEAPNSEIRKKIGFKKLIAHQHVPNQKDRSKYNAKMPAFTLSRSTVMTDWFQKIKNREIIFPRWEDFEPFAKDILNINMEYKEERGTLRYVNEEPDDFFQTLIYGGEVALSHKEAMIEVY